MPSLKHRQRILADNFITKTGVNRDLVINWPDWFIAASGVSGMSGSVAISTISGSIHALSYTGTSNACPIFLTAPIPQDVAISGPASGSGTLYVDWTDVTTATAVATITASLYAIPNGSSLGDSGTSTLATTCATITGTTASEFQSSSVVEFNRPNTRAGFFALRFIVNSTDNGNTSGSNFHLLGVRLRYKSDRMGS